MNFIPDWSMSVLLVILVCWVLGLALGRACTDGDRIGASIHDVPCQPCQRGYGEQHECEDPDHCACDQGVKHSNGPDVCEHGADPVLCVYCWLDRGAKR